MVAEILCVGTELLLGQVLNTDAQFLSRQLSEMGIELYRIETVGDNPGRVRKAGLVPARRAHTQKRARHRARLRGRGGRQNRDSAARPAV